MKKILVFSVLFAVILSGCGHTHHFTPATCTEPEVCAECGATQGEPLGHDWIEATCTAPQMCSRCGETKGLALGHQTETIFEKEATCIEPGIEVQKCKNCDFSVTRVIPASDHTKTIYCEKCGEPTIVLCEIGQWYDFEDLSIRVDSITDRPDQYDYHHILVKYTLRNNTRDYTESYSLGVYRVYNAEDDNGYGWKLSPEETYSTSMEWTVKDEDLSVALIQYPASGTGRKINPDALHWIALPIGVPDE